MNALNVQQAMEQNSDTNSVSGSETGSPSSQAEIARQKYQRRVTKTFFIVGVIFIAVALPATIAPVVIGIPVAYQKYRDEVMSYYYGGKNSHNYAAVVVPLRIFYCFIPVINPFLYAFSNNMVKERLKNLFRKICQCCGGQSNS